MSNDRMLRWLGPLGVGFLAAVVIAFPILSNNTPGQNASTARVMAYYSDHGTRQTAAIWVMGIGLALLTFYVCGLRTALRRANPEHSWLATATFAGGLVFITGFAVTGITQYALVQAVHNNRATLAVDLNFVAGIIPLPLWLGVGVMGLAAGVDILAGSVLPKWLGVVGIVMAALTALGPIGFIAVLALPVWFTILGFVIAAKLAPHEHAAAAAGPAAPDLPDTEARRSRMRHLVPRGHH